jgi:RHS repeat-associated protein
VEAVTGTAGTPAATYGYTAYGSNITSMFTGADKTSTAPGSSTTPYSSYRYNAMRWDPGSGQYDMGFRNYDPGLNAFTSRDMYDGALADMNLTTDPFTGSRYAFGNGNPVSNIESDGHMPCIAGGPCGSISALARYWTAEQNASSSSASGGTASGGGCGFLGWNCLARQAGNILGGAANGIIDTASSGASILGSLASQMANAFPTGITPSGQLTFTNHATNPVPTSPLNIGDRNSIPYKAGYYGWALLFSPAAAEETGSLAEDAGAVVRGCGESFTASTKVLLATGKAIPISQLKPGDKVLATSTRTGKTQAETVTAVLLHHDTDLYNLRIKVGNKTAVIHTTSNHLFWDPYPHQGWIPANHLKPGMYLKTPDGQSAVVVGGSTPAVHDGWMWDLTVPGNNDHDFYVAVAATAVLVHNIDCERVAQQTLGPNSGSGVSLERGDSFTQEEQQLINESGDANGCSTCDATKSGWRDGHWTVDHQPPNKLAPNGPWTGYPQCAACARQQGGIVRTILQEMYDFPPELSMGDS